MFVLSFFSLLILFAYLFCCFVRPALLRRCDQAFMPPSTVRFAPVMKDASGPATNAPSRQYRQPGHSD